MAERKIEEERKAQEDAIAAEKERKKEELRA